MTIANINDEPRRPRPVIRPFRQLDMVDKAAEIHRRTRIGQTVAEIAAAVGVTPGAISEIARTEGLAVHSEQNCSKLWPKKFDFGVKGRAPVAVRRPLPTVVVELVPTPRLMPPANLLDRPGGRIILQLVAMKHRFTVEEINGPRKTKSLVAARDEAIRLIRDHCPQLSLPMIGRLVGGRDHSTIMHSLSKTAVKL